MKRIYFACMFLCLTATCLFSQSNPALGPTSAPKADPKAQAKILDSYGKLPLSFEANHGQTDARVKFLSRTGGYTLFLTGDEAVFTFGGKKTDTHKAKIARTAQTLPSTPALKVGGVLRMKLRNANPAAKVTGVDELAGTSNYFIGNDPAKWRRNVPTYAKVKYEGIYSGIDLVYYGNQRQLEYDFIVAPGANPHRIQFDVRGAKRIRQDEHGDLVFKVGEGEIHWHKPVVYQEQDGARHEIAARYAITDENRVGFELAKYDASRPLYIDPLIYSTYLGGSGDDVGYGIAVDSAGNAYVTGSTGSTDFPTMNPLQPSNHSTGPYPSNAFVSEINPTGSALVYSTYLGGSGRDSGLSIAVDSTGNAYVTGPTSSTDFPVTPGAFQMTCVNPSPCNNAFVTKLGPSGSALIYSTYFVAYADGIAIDSAGNAYITGYASSDFQATPGAFQTTCGSSLSCAFVTKINPTGSALVYSTYLGGSGEQEGHGIAVDSSDDAYVTGFTSSTDFPVTPRAFQMTIGGRSLAAFVSEFNPMGSALVYSTYLSVEAGSQGSGIAVNGAGNAYVTGVTQCAKKGPFGQQPCWTQNTSTFVAEINPTGSALGYLIVFAPPVEYNSGNAIAVDNTGNVYVTGVASQSFPTTPGALKKTCKKPCGDAFLTKLNPTGSVLAYSTYLGGSTGNDWGNGIAVDSENNAYVTGFTGSTDFPVTPGALQTTYGGGGSDTFVTKIDPQAATTMTLSSSPNPSTYGEAVTFKAVVTSSIGGPPDGETVTFKKGTTVLGTGSLSGGSATFTTSTLKVGTTSVTAVYGGDSNFAGSKSNVVKQVVKKTGINPAAQAPVMLVTDDVWHAY